MSVKVCLNIREKEKKYTEINAYFLKENAYAVKKNADLQKAYTLTNRIAYFLDRFLPKIEEIVEEYKVLPFESGLHTRSLNQYLQKIRKERGEIDRQKVARAGMAYDGRIDNFLGIMRGNIKKREVGFLSNYRDEFKAKLPEYVAIMKVNRRKADTLKKERDKYLLTDYEKEIKERGECPMLLKTHQEKEDFTAAGKTNTIVSYTEFMAKYPQSKFVKDAKRAINFINNKNDKIYFLSKKKENTKRAFKDYLKKYPQGKYKNQAEEGIKKIDTQQDAALWKKALESDTEKGFLFYLKYYPEGMHAEQAHEKVKFLRFKKAVEVAPEQVRKLAVSIKKAQEEEARTAETIAHNRPENTKNTSHKIKTTMVKKTAPPPTISPKPPDGPTPYAGKPPEKTGTLPRLRAETGGQERREKQHAARPAVLPEVQRGTRPEERREQRPEVRTTAEEYHPNSKKFGRDPELFYATGTKKPRIQNAKILIDENGKKPRTKTEIILLGVAGLAVLGGAVWGVSTLTKKQK